MKRKILHIFIVLTVILHTFWPSFLYAKQAAVCSSPSKEMSLYFDYQREALTLLMWNYVKEASIEKLSETPWLYSLWILTPKSGSGDNSTNDSAISKMTQNLRASMRANVVSFASAWVTTTILLMLASSQVFESWFQSLFWVLWSDRYIVRDYKKMLEIDTRIMNVAYSLSDKVLLTAKLENDGIKDNWKNLIEKYANLGLFTRDNMSNTIWDLSVASLLQDLSELNGAMKWFLSFELMSKSILENFNWCFGNHQYEANGEYTCISPYYKFSDKAIKNLVNDYKDRHFSSCNSSWRDFWKSLSKTLDNNIDDMKDTVKEVKHAYCRLMGALWHKNLGDACKDEKYSGKWRCEMTPYEMAYLRSYYGGDRKCENRVVSINSNVAGDISDLIDNNFVTSMVKNLQNHKNKTITYGKWKSKYKKDKRELELKCKEPDDICWYKYFGNSSIMNDNYDRVLEQALNAVFDEVEIQHRNSRFDAMSIDSKNLMVWIMWTIDTVWNDSSKVLGDTKIWASKWINKVFEFQCSY